jgi:enoyl-CoA hydratase/carnithine racemase
MAAGAHLVFSQVRMGLMTGWGGGPRLVRAIGPTRALRILATGAYVSAEEAAAMGLAELAPEGLALAHALDLARQITRHPPGSVAAIKSLVWHSAGQTLAEGQAHENALFSQRWGSEEHRAAVAEFMQRRAPRFD